MGSLIMPHNIYLHSALVQTRKLPTGCAASKREALMYFGIESALSLGVGVHAACCMTHGMCNVLISGTNVSHQRHSYRNVHGCLRTWLISYTTVASCACCHVGCVCRHAPVDVYVAHTCVEAMHTSIARHESCPISPTSMFTA